MRNAACLLALLLLVTSHLSAQETQTFPAPSVDGRRIDICLEWGAQCGQPAADTFCREQGFDGASAWEPDEDIGAETPTVVLIGRAVCDQPFCDGFATITCASATPSATPLPIPSETKVFEYPQTGGTPVDWCLEWGAYCGQPAADRFCRDQGYPAAISFEIAEDVGHTVVQSTGQPCDDPLCDGFALIECGNPPWTTQDVIDDRIDVQAQYALMRMFVGEPDERADASYILESVKAGWIAGIYQEDQQVPALRAQSLGFGWWEILPKKSDAQPYETETIVNGTCMTEPSEESPIVVVRRDTEANPPVYDMTLRNAWYMCGVPPVASVRSYKVTLPAKQPAVKETACVTPSYAEHSDLLVRVTQEGAIAEGFSVEVLNVAEHISHMTETDEHGVVHFSGITPGQVVVGAGGGFPLSPTASRTVNILPNCIHTIIIDLDSRGGS